METCLYIYCSHDSAWLEESKPTPCFWLEDKHLEAETNLETWQQEIFSKPKIHGFHIIDRCKYLNIAIL